MGLNVFASARVRDLPAEIREPLSEILTEMSTDASLIVVGHGGRRLWENFTPPLDSSTHPIDTFSIGEMQKFMAEVFPGVSAALAFPHPGIILPLQKLGRHLNLARPSRLGLDIHREYGPWFAYRVVVVVDAAIPEVDPGAFESPCASCATVACAVACPSGAVAGVDGGGGREGGGGRGGGGADFAQTAEATSGAIPAMQLNKCASYRISANSSCEDRCHARLACPVGAEHRYTIEQIRYHMLRPEHLRRLSTYR